MRVGIAYVVVAWLVLQVADIVFDAIGTPEWVLPTLLAVMAIGLPIALLFAWAFELTPEGIKRESEVDRSESVTSQTGQKLNRTIIVLMALALGYFAVDKFWLQRQPDDMQTATAEVASPVKAAHTIAVLPLADMSPGGDNAYFSDGLTEELLNMLSKIGELQVAGRTSSFAFKGKNEDLRDIGQKLNVETILEGSVRKDDERNRVRITLQLINVEDGYHLWSETYDREMDDIFAIQEDVALEVARALRIELLGEDQARLEQVATTEITTYEAYLQGMHNLHEGGFDSLDRAEDYLQQALSQDPGYLPARLALVHVWSDKAQTGVISQREAVSRGMPILERVLEEQPGNAEAHVQKALLQIYARENEAAEQSFQTALQLAPQNARGLQEYGRFLFDNLQAERGLEMIQAAVELEPYSIPVLWDQCQTRGRIQQLEAALNACERIREINPDSPLGYYGRGNAFGYSGNLAQMVKGFSEAIERDPGDYEMLAGQARFWLLLGDSDQARDWLQRAEAIGAGQAIPNASRVNLLSYQERTTAAADLARRAILDNPENRFGVNGYFRIFIAHAAVAQNAPEVALREYQRDMPWMFEPALNPPADVYLDIGDVLIAARLLQLADPLSNRANELLDVAQAHAKEFHPGWGLWRGEVQQAQIHALRGETSLALDRLENARDMNWRLGWRPSLTRNPVFDSLRSEPRFQELLAFYETDMDRQRQEAYALMDIAP